MLKKIILFVVILQQIICTTTSDSKCGVIPATKWSGEPSRRTNTLKTPVKLVVIQHTVSVPCYTDYNCESVLKNIRDYQINNLHFIDIGPSFLIGGNGKVYEGAGWSHVGAHTRGYNNLAIGISFIGDFTYELPTPEALQAAQELLHCGIKNNFLIEDYRLVGHRQLSTTSSPGDRLQSYIKTLSHWTYAVK